MASLALGMALLGRVAPVTWTVAYAMARAGAAAMAWLMQRRGADPRWDWWTTAGQMSVMPLTSVSRASAPAVWERQMRPNAWMLPWFLLVLGTAYS